MNRLIAPLALVITLAAAGSAWAAPSPSGKLDAAKFFAERLLNGN